MFGTVGSNPPGRIPSPATVSPHRPLMIFGTTLRSPIRTSNRSRRAYRSRFGSAPPSVPRQDAVVADRGAGTGRHRQEHGVTAFGRGSVGAAQNRDERALQKGEAVVVPAQVDGVVADSVDGQRLVVG